jgi:prolyl-tRNA editing enzyme YbaK/EbsC (Cys-tRNA(Pro) deacylase)
MSKSLTRVKRALADAGLEIEVLEMVAETRTAAQAAEAAGVELDQIAKSIIFKGATSGKPILFLTAGGNQVSPDKAAHVAGEALTKADAALIRAETGFAIGGVAPIGHLNDIACFMDPRLLEFDMIYAAAGTPRHIFPINSGDLQRISDAQVTVFI